MNTIEYRVICTGEDGTEWCYKDGIYNFDTAVDYADKARLIWDCARIRIIETPLAPLHTNWDDYQDEDDYYGDC